MNTFIETLNQWGGNYSSFAWPMLWQSSLLIAVLAAFDFLFRRKLRASVRYALWLVVLVKLCIPPTLASPTSPAWWLHKTPPPAVAKVATHYTVTYDNTSMPQISQTSLAVVARPKPTLNFPAWLLMVSAVASLALFVWLLVRWWQIVGQVYRAKMSDRLSGLAETEQKFAGMKRKVPVKLTANSMSPAVCGLIRPAILIPQSLAENFSDEQLRAVLLHELIHLRRCDVWVNFVQALLQIVYWWHPLVWLANARIRRVREEAVDDVVMLALRDEAETYAPTLLEVAKLALNRPLASLGLVGILESRHSLRQRIERLVDFHPPRQAGLTLVSLFGILAFTAVAVPMGEGPTTTEKQPASAPDVSVPTGIVQKTNPSSVLITAQFFQGRGVVVEEISRRRKNNSRGENRVRWWPVLSSEFNQISNVLNSAGWQKISAPRVLTLSGQTAEVFVGNDTHSVGFTCLPVVADGLIQLATQGKVIDQLVKNAFTNEFAAKTSVENRGGILVRVTEPGDSAASNLVVLISAEIVTNTARFQQRLQAVIKREPPASVGEAQNLVQDGKLLYEMGKLDEAEVKLKAALALDTNNAAAKYYLEMVQSARRAMKWGVTKPERQNIVKKLDHIQLASFGPFMGVSLGEVVRQLNEMAQQKDSEKTGVEIVILTNSLSTRPPGIDSVAINLPVPLMYVKLGDALDAVVQNASMPLKYSILDDSIVLSMKDGSDLPILYNRHFRVDPNIFTDAMQNASGIKSNSVPVMVRDFFKTLGVNLDPTTPGGLGKSLFYGDRLGELFVRATAQDLDTIENALEVLNQARPQIHIKARFLKVPKGTVAGFGNLLNSTNSTTGQFTGILSDTNARVVLHSLESRKDVDILAEPEVVTISGRQTQMRATQTITSYDVLQQTLMADHGKMTVSDSNLPQTSQIEVGPVLDVVPYVLSDGYTINLTVIPSLTEFLGYDKSNNSSKTLPRFRTRQVVTTLNLWDGQTAIIGGLPEKEYVNGKEVADLSKASDKELLVFVTATIVDPVGNRVHSDDELPFTKTGVPTQPAQMPSPPK